MQNNSFLVCKYLVSFIFSKFFFLISRPLVKESILHKIKSVPCFSICSIILIKQLSFSISSSDNIQTYWPSAREAALIIPGAIFLFLSSLRYCILLKSAINFWETFLVLSTLWLSRIKILTLFFISGFENCLVILCRHSSRKRSRL